MQLEKAWNGEREADGQIENAQRPHAFPRRRVSMSAPLMARIESPQKPVSARQTTNGTHTAS